MSSLAKRVLSAALFLPLFILLLVKGTPFHFFLLLVPVVLLALNEFYSFRKDALPQDLILFGYVWALALLFAAYTGTLHLVAALLATGLVVFFLLRIIKTGEMTRVINDAGFLALTVLYIPFLLSHLVLLRGLENGPYWVLMLFVMTWGNDTAAYFAGVNFGKRKLCPSISPNKSVEGLIGGFAGSVAGALIFKLALFPAITLADSIFLALIVGVIGPFGDLAESLLKRSSGVKDSGALIPGHGGILDRIDSILFTAPVVFYFAFFRYGAGF